MLFLGFLRTFLNSVAALATLVAGVACLSDGHLAGGFLLLSSGCVFAFASCVDVVSRGGQ